jgi:hypothetical protein
MKMTKQLFCMTALAALAVSSQAVRADEYVMPDAQQFARYEADAQPMTCAQATAFAWFKQQLELDRRQHRCRRGHAGRVRAHLPRQVARQRRRRQVIEQE